jgi:drug/metabolite transporter (DMT)-like permease
VATAAVVHAAWNLVAKRAATAGPSFVWMVSAGAALLWAPVAAAVALGAFGTRPTFGGAGAAFAAGSAVLHVGYFLCLQLGYRLGDLSTVYPLARGTGPVVATFGAVVLFGERPSAVALAGLLLVCGGVATIARSGATVAAATGRAPTGSGARFGVLTGVFIAAYTLWDAEAVASLGIAPVVYSWATAVGETVVLAPVAARSPDAVRRTWCRHRRDVLVVAILSPLAYVLVLVALTLAPVSYVAPARELSIVVGAFLGGRLLDEADQRRRVVASCAVAAGVVALAVG